MITWVTTAVCLSPLVILLGSKALTIAEGGFWIPQPSAGSILDTFIEYSSGFLVQQVLPGSKDQIILGFTWGKYVLFAIFAIFAVAGLFLHRKSQDKQNRKRFRDRLQNKAVQNERISGNAVLLLLLWLFVPIILPFVVSQIITPIYLTRYTIGASPAFFILVAKGMSIVGKKGLFSIMLIVAILSSLGLYGYYTITIKEQWREAASLVEMKSQQQDSIILCESFVQLPFDYYYKGTLEQIGVKKNVDANDLAALDKQIKGKNRVWLIISNVSELPPVHSYLKGKYQLEEWFGYRGIVVFLFDLVPVGRQ